MVRIHDGSPERGGGGGQHCKQRYGPAWTRRVLERDYQVVQKLIPLCGQKELYAPAEAIEEINKFMGSLSKLIEEHLKGHLADGEATAPQECLQAIRSAAGKLAGIGRGHLGLEKLPSALTDSKQRFLGSFRGRTLGSHQDALS